MRLKMPAVPKCLSAKAIGRPVGVDRKNNVLQGYVVAQMGPFKSEGRGEFDLSALNEIVRLGNETTRGIKSRFTHPDMSSDGLGKHLGRASSFSMSTAIDARTAKKVPAVRADLTFDKTALDTPPNGGKAYGLYIMDLAESDPESFSSSLVLEAEQSFRLNKDGTAQTDRDGNELPPLWMPTRLHASDIVDTGDAVDSVLSVEGLPLKQLWTAAGMLDSIFDGQSREVIEARLTAYVNRYLDRRFGGARLPLETPRLDQYRKALWRMQERVDEFSSSAPALLAAR